MTHTPAQQALGSAIGTFLGQMLAYAWIQAVADEGRPLTPKEVLFGTKGTHMTKEEFNTKRDNLLDQLPNEFRLPVMTYAEYHTDWPRGYTAMLSIIEDLVDMLKEPIQRYTQTLGRRHALVVRSTHDGLLMRPVEYFPTYKDAKIRQDEVLVEIENEGLINYTRIEGGYDV